VLTSSLDGWVAGWVALEEWKLRLTSAKVELKLRLSLAMNWLETFDLKEAVSYKDLKPGFTILP